MAPSLYRSFVRPLMFRLDAERAHNLALYFAELGGRAPAITVLARHLCPVFDQRLEVRVAGMSFCNPLGLAAGFDKNARALRLLSSIGFGHIEIGSVSAFPSSGNPRPRLFRVRADDAIIVNYGVPNEGAAAVARRIAGARGSIRLPVGTSLVKTNDPLRPAVELDVYEDYRCSLQLLGPLSDYVMLNLSCPNSLEDRDFFDHIPRIGRLLETVASAGGGSPIFLKLKPTLDLGVLRAIVSVTDEFPIVQGFAINLPAGKPNGVKLSLGERELASMPGAVAGRPVRGFIDKVLRALAHTVGPDSRYSLIAAGGVSSAEDAYHKIRFGASLVQLYSGLVFQGPKIVNDILSGLLHLLEEDGFACVSDAIGADIFR